MRHAYLIVLLGFSISLWSLSGCTKDPDFWKEATTSQKKVLVSFPPLFSITHAVGGPDTYVLCLLTSTGPHDYDAGPADLLKVRKADLVIYNGLTLDDKFIERMVRSVKHAAPPTLNVGAILEEKHHDLMLEAHEHDDGEGHKHKHGEHDPHIWLGPDLAMQMTDIIASKLSELDPAHKSGYRERAKKFKEELQSLDAYGKNAFKDKKSKSILTQHESLGYFARAFGLDIRGAIQMRPGIDPDSVTLGKLVEVCTDKANPVHVFAVEPQYPKSQAETLRRSLKAKGVEVTIVEIDPLETAPIPEGRFVNPDPHYYLTRMRENIDTLAKALP